MQSLSSIAPDFLPAETESQPRRLQPRQVWLLFARRERRSAPTDRPRVLYCREFSRLENVCGQIHSLRARNRARLAEWHDVLNFIDKFQQRASTPVRNEAVAA